MIKALRNEKLQLLWLAVNAAIGFTSVTTKFVLIAWFVVVTGSFLLGIFTSKEPQMNLLCYLAFLLGIEVLGRGVGAAPYIPHEIGKYAILFGFIYGLFLGGPIKTISTYGIAMILLSLPALVVAPTSFGRIVFNYFGPLGLFLGVIFCKKQIVTYSQFKEIARIVVYSVFALVCYTMFRANTFERIEYNLTANFESSGGSITNQVATLFGTAACLIALMYLTKQQLFKYKWIEISILCLFLVRGLLSFSRGGMVSAALSIFIVVLLPKGKNIWGSSETEARKIKPVSIILIGVFMLFSFFLVNSFTNNFLLYRYQGKTQRSLETGFDNRKDADQLTSGRYTVMISDFNMFLAYPAFGIGIGKSSELRGVYGGANNVISHLELSRLFAEHGSLGLFLVILMFIYPFFLAFNEQDYYKKLIMTIFLVMALSTTFHNAMRTMITPFLFSLAFLNYVPNDFNMGNLNPAEKKRHAYTKRKQPV